MDKPTTTAPVKRPITPPHLRTKENGWCFVNDYRTMPREPEKKKTKGST